MRFLANTTLPAPTRVILDMEVVFTPVPDGNEEIRRDRKMHFCDIQERMSTAIDALLMSAPFGSISQSVNSPRYYWDNARRGDERFVIFQWTMEGTGGFSLNGKSWSLSSGEAFIAVVPEESSYYFPRQAVAPWRFAWLNFYGPSAISFIQKFRETYGPILPLPLHSVAGSMFLRLAQMAEMRAFPDRCEASAACYAFLMEWTRQLMRPANQDGDPVETAMTFCRSRFREPLGVKELAAVAGLTREHLTRIFTARTGVSPGRYLRNLRVDAARQMMESHNVPLKEIALRCGFASARSLAHAMAATDGDT